MGKLFEVILNQTYFSQQCVNRWNYSMVGTPSGVTGSFALINALGAILEGDPLDLPVDGFMAVLQALQNSQVVYVDIMARAIYDPTDFYTYTWTTPIVGGVTGGGTSPTQAFGFRTNRLNQDVRRGQKRFVGVSISDDTNGGLFTGTTITRMNALADSMSAVLEYTAGGNSLQFNPSVFQKEKITDTDGKVTYKYFTSEATQEAHSVGPVTWERLPEARTQATRQYGRGQ